MPPTTATAFGAELGLPAQTCAVLRARASAAGVTLLPASAEDMAAAVLGAHAWMVTLGKGTLSGPHTQDQTSALATVLARACGHADDEPDWSDEHTDVESLPQHALAQIAPVATWAAQVAGSGSIRRAAADLAVSDNERVISASYALSLFADAFDLTRSLTPAGSSTHRT